MLFFLLYFTQMVSSSLCFDLQLEGAVHFGKDMMRRFGDDVLELDALEGPLSKDLVQLMSAPPFNIAIPNINAKQSATGTQKDGNKQKKIKMADNTHQTIVIPFEKLNKRFNDEFRSELSHQLRIMGTHGLKTLANYFKNNLNTDTDITTVLKKATNSYLTAEASYYVFISKQSIKHDIDKEFVVLDMIETSSNLLMNEAKKLLDVIIKTRKTDGKTTGVDMPELMENIKTTVLQAKKDQLRHVCKTMDICRPFPGFCDHTADLIRDILQLNDSSLLHVIKSLNESINAKRAFFETILNASVRTKISSQLNTSFHNIAFLREVLSMLRVVITRRHKMFKSDSFDVSVKTKAVRILLDLIDKVFDEVNDEELNSMEIQNTINGYRQWAAGERSDLDLITKKFVYNAVELLNYNWGKESKEEVKVLTDVLFAGSTANLEVYDYLFKNGSLFVRDKVTHVHSDFA